LEYEVYITVKEQTDASKLLLKYQDELADLLITSDVHINEAPRTESWNYCNDIDLLGSKLSIAIVPAGRNKCPRCWKYTAPQPDYLCDRCEKTVSK
jgi:isoleucyl-tRNA synthetase